MYFTIRNWGNVVKTMPFAPSPRKITLFKKVIWLPFPNGVVYGIVLITIIIIIIYYYYFYDDDYYYYWMYPDLGRETQPQDQGMGQKKAQVRNAVEFRESAW